tara:strand:- start:171 stop:467 length:297 start_codon:yes stop_codon:yes gene_type:complete
MRKKRAELFDEEIGIFREEKELLKNEEATIEEVILSNKRLLKAYKDLIDQSKLSTKISDKLIFGLNANYTEILDENKVLTTTIRKHESTFLSKLFNWK